jgi:hypothetical protein
MTEYEQNIEIMKDLRNRLDKVLDTSAPPASVKHPDPKKHLYISLAKSFIRIVAGVTLVVGMPVYAGSLLIAAEVLGIFEELV